MSQKQHKEERQFGLVFAGFFTLLALWPLWPLHAPKYLWLIPAALSLILGLFLPRVLAPFNRVWMAIGHALGWVNSKIVLGFLFFVIVTPIALGLKLAGRDPLSRRLRQADSYWVKRENPWTTESMRDQF